MVTHSCIIVDDEQPAHIVLKSHIDKVSSLKLVKSAYNGLEALNYLISHAVDIIFLDIEMPDMQGIELIKTLPYKSQIILTTAYDQFGYEAYQHDVVDYWWSQVSNATN